MYFLKKIIVSIVLLLTTISSFACHLQGGEITYRYLGNDNYEIQLKLYRDCNNIFNPYDTLAFIAIYDANKKLINNLAVPFPGAHRVLQLSPNVCLIPPDVCTEEAVYVDTVNLPFVAGGYDVAYQRCCRFGAINIKDPSTTGVTYYAHIAASNSSPVFNKIPPIFLCVNKNLNFDYSATDPDGDSLVYDICTPYDGSPSGASQPNPADPPPYNNVIWSMGYNASHPMYASPDFAINPNTGLLTGTPIQEGIHLFAVCVSEYRNGKLLSVNKRDFQFVVVTCQTIAAVPTQQIYCDGLTVGFNNNSQNTNQYAWDFGDRKNQNDTSTFITPQYTYPDTGIYTIRLIASNTAANCADTAYNTFTIAPPFKPVLNVPASICLLDSKTIYSIGAKHSGTAAINWDFGAHANPQYIFNDSVSNIKFDASGDFYITATVSQNGCTYTANKTIQVVDTAHVEISETTQYCVGQSVHFGSYATSVSNTLWDFGVNGITTDTSTNENPTYIYPDTGKYKVTLIGSNNICPADTQTRTFYVYPKLQINPSTAVAQQCIDDAGFNFKPTGVWDSSAQFHWHFIGGNPDSLISNNPKSIKYMSTGIQKAFLTVTQYGCSKQAMYLVKVIPKPQVDFYSNRTNGCVPFTTQFFDTLLNGNPIKSYQWKYENIVDTIKSPKHSFNHKNSYDVTLMVQDIFGCTNQLTKTHYITTDTKVGADFTIKPNPANILNPEVSLIDTSKNTNTTSIYILPDDEIINSRNANFRLNDTGTFEFVKIVTTNLGCSDTIRKSVRCNPVPAIYIPNAFTPNNDGLNDLFMPEVIRATEINFKIFDRWGELIFETNELKKGWDGKMKTGKTAELGAYVYQIYIEFFDGTNKSELGTFSLIR